jgi:hypothetical protein
LPNRDLRLHRRLGDGSGGQRDQPLAAALPATLVEETGAAFPPEILGAPHLMTALVPGPAVHLRTQGLDQVAGQGLASEVEVVE